MKCHHFQNRVFFNQLDHIFSIFFNFLSRQNPAYDPNLHEIDEDDESEEYEEEDEDEEESEMEEESEEESIPVPTR